MKNHSLILLATVLFTVIGFAVFAFADTPAPQAVYETEVTVLPLATSGHAKSTMEAELKKRNRDGFRLISSDIVDFKGDIVFKGQKYLAERGIILIFERQVPSR